MKVVGRSSKLGRSSTIRWTTGNDLRCCVVYATVLRFARHEPNLVSRCGSGVLGAMVALGVIGTWQFLETAKLDPLGFLDLRCVSGRDNEN